MASNFCETDNITIEKVQQEFPNLCKGIGKLKNNPIKLHIDENIIPVARKTRRTSFSLREKVEQELKRLQEADIIEPVKGTTPWISPIVLVSKRDKPDVF